MQPFVGDQATRKSNAALASITTLNTGSVDQLADLEPQRRRMGRVQAAMEVQRNVRGRLSRRMTEIKRAATLPAAFKAAASAGSVGGVEVK